MPARVDKTRKHSYIRELATSEWVRIKISETDSVQDVRKSLEDKCDYIDGLKILNLKPRIGITKRTHTRV